MELIRVWSELDIAEIKEHIVMADDKFGHCPNCKKIGIDLKDLKKCPSCGREFKYITSKEASGGKIDIVARLKKKLPDLAFVDYSDYERLTGKRKAEDLFSV
ncbi:MAG TPA: hypothetical protein P5346_05055 [Spirochaetota bacterium]|nr:hypothetical protein [Spirochaetota bacterium]HSA14094.1 hypothetical protein [Spirochaetota bacterium]